MARLIASFKDLTDADFIELIRLGKEQSVLMDALTEAVQARDTLRILHVAEQMVGLEDEAKKIGDN
jgi:hypothetical protein